MMVQRVDFEWNLKNICPGDHSILFLPSTLSSQSWTLEGLSKLTRRPSVLLVLQGIKDTVRCHAKCRVTRTLSRLTDTNLDCAFFWKCTCFYCSINCSCRPPPPDLYRFPNKGPVELPDLRSALKWLASTSTPNPLSLPQKSRAFCTRSSGLESTMSDPKQRRIISAWFEEHLPSFSIWNEIRVKP